MMTIIWIGLVAWAGYFLGRSDGLRQDFEGGQVLLVTIALCLFVFFIFSKG